MAYIFENFYKKIEIFIRKYKLCFVRGWSMKRKVIQIANSTQLISLPRKWAIKHNIKKGDELDVTIDGSQLLVGAKLNSQYEAAQLNFDKNTPYLKRALSTLYKLGYDEVEISFDDPALINKIKIHAEQLMGFEIIQQTARRCTVKNVAATIESEFDNILRRIFMTLVSFARESYSAIADKKFEDLRSIADLEKTNNKLSHFCERVINKFGYADHKRQFLLYNLISMMEQSADAFGFICYYLADNPKAKISKQLLDAYLLVCEVIGEMQQTFYDFNVKRIVEMKEKRKKIEKILFEQLKSGNPDERVLCHQLLVITYLVHHSTECMI